MNREEDSNGFITAGENGETENEREEQEQVLLALIEHRTKEVEKNQWRLNHYRAELDQSQRKLEETKAQLARLRGQHNLAPSQKVKDDDISKVKTERRSISPTNNRSDSPQQRCQLKLEQRPDSAKPSKNLQRDVKDEKGSSSTTSLQINDGSSQKKNQSKPQIVIPAVNRILPQPINGHSGNISNCSGLRPSEPVTANPNSSAKSRGDKSCKISSEQEAVGIHAKGKKRKFEQKEQSDLIRLIGRSSSACTIHCQTGCIIPSQHKRKLRSLVLCPTNDQLFVTSALDGVVNLWQIQSRGSSASFLSSTDCASLKQRRWPEDIAWHPNGNSLFSVYSADGGDSQVAVMDLNKAKERSRVNFLEDKPHVKGIINSIMFMPWEDTYFVTGGSDHAVIFWTEKDGVNNWKPKALHRNLHSSAVMGVAGMQHKQIVISAGADKRITGYDVLAGRADYRHQIESKCMSVVPNPCDFNLFMVQTGTPGKQLRLFDYRVRQTEVHAFGWEQESSESQSALINQAWSPDGLYITSGSADPVIHIFDIRYNSQKPTQSIRAHQKRVFKAVWHHSLPLLISISSDLNIGLHKIM